jgi:hypothetical protein
MICLPLLSKTTMARSNVFRLASPTPQNTPPTIACVQDPTLSHYVILSSWEQNLTTDKACALSPSQNAVTEWLCSCWDLAASAPKPLRTTQNVCAETDQKTCTGAVCSYLPPRWIGSEGYITPSLSSSLLPAHHNLAGERLKVLQEVGMSGSVLLFSKTPNRRTMCLSYPKLAAYRRMCSKQAGCDCMFSKILPRPNYVLLSS